MDFEKDVEKAKEKVAEFVRAAKNSGYNLECFIDKVERWVYIWLVLGWKSFKRKEFLNSIFVTYDDKIAGNPYYLEFW